MSTPATMPPCPPLPPLRAGDRLTALEFERRWAAMPELKKAELIAGVVYLPAPVAVEDHVAPPFDLIGWLGVYKAFTVGVQGGAHATLRLDLDNRPQPDAFLRILPRFGGQSRTSADGYVVAAPELAAEIAASSVSYDLHDKLETYRRHGVREYVVWRVEDGALDWFILRDGRFEIQAPGPDGLHRSEVFPGLWLDAAALLHGDPARVLQVVQMGTQSPEHAAFVSQLRQSAALPTSE